MPNEPRRRPPHMAKLKRHMLVTIAVHPDETTFNVRWVRAIIMGSLQRMAGQFDFPADVAFGVVHKPQLLDNIEAVEQAVAALDPFNSGGAVTHPDGRITGNDEATKYKLAQALAALRRYAESTDE